MTKAKQFFILAFIILTGIALMKIAPSPTSTSKDPDLLSTFDNVKEWGISPERGFSLSRSRKHATEGTYALKVVYPKWGLPSINTKKLNQDWGDYEYFSFDVYNPHKEEIKLNVRLDDPSRKRVTLSRTLLPGANRIKISRSEIAKKIDPAKIFFVVLFLEEPGKRYTLYFDNMRLERSLLSQDIQLAATTLPVDEHKIAEDVRSQRSQVSPEKRVAVPIIKVAVARLRDVPENKPLVSSGVPFAPGQLKDEKELAFFDGQGNEIPIATKILARWPQDNSIRSVLVQFRYPVERLYAHITMKWGERRQTKDLQIVEPKWEYPEGIVVPPAEWLCASQVIGEQVPMGKNEFPKYDQNIEKYFPLLKDQPLTGDPRKDGYYSTPHVFYQLYVRSGQLQHFLAARKELLHYRENSIIHEGEQKGRSTAGREPRYVYMQAMADDYFLTGDPRTLEVAKEMVGYLEKNFDPRNAYYAKVRTNFWTERLYAFPFLGVLTYYEMTGEEKYLQLAAEYMANLYKTQSEWPGRGGFIHNLYAHDTEEGCRPDEYGGSPFMTGLLLEPIIKLHRLTGSTMVADSIFKALDWIILEGLSEGGDSFKYLTCDKFRYSDGTPDINLLVVHAFGYGYRLSNYEREDYDTVGRKVFERGVENAFLKTRKHFNQNYRSSGHFLAYIKDAPIRTKEEAKAAAQRALLDDAGALQYENFESSNGRFASSGGTNLSLDENNAFSGTRSLRITGKSISGNLSAGFDVEPWPIDNFPIVSFAYRIPPNTPVGMRARTEYGDWVCIGGTRMYKCAGTPAKELFELLDDGQWHQADIPVDESVSSVLRQLKRLSAFQFFTGGNAQPGDQFWIDEFMIKR